MYRVALLNLPFAAVHLPSIALTQLKHIAQEAQPGRVEAKVFYLNLELARYLGLQTYQLVSDSLAATHSGLGDWLFRAVAFPDVPDNHEEYLKRYHWHFNEQRAQIAELCGPRRDTLADFLDELIERYRLHEFDAVGFTSMFQQNMACFAMARRLKARAPRLVTLLGGANCESPMGQVIARNVSAMDFVFSGPALKTFPLLMQHLADGRPEACHDIPGVFSRERLARQANLEHAAEIGAELDINVEVPLDYDDFLDAIDRHFPPGAVNPTLLFETSRGCWWGERAHCTFCGLNGMTMKYRALEPDRALRLLSGLFTRYSNRVSLFSAVDNIMPREYLASVFPRLERPPNASLFYEVKADLSDEEMATLARAGVTEVQPGIESLASSTLKLMKKGSTALQNVAFLKRCLAHRVSPGWNLLVGFPGEQEAVYEKYIRDLPLLWHLPPPSGAFPVRFDRFSPYFTRADEYGLQLAPYDFYFMLYPFPEEELRNLAYYFVDENYEAPYIEGLTKWLPDVRKQVDAWRRRWADGKPEPRLEYVQRGTGPTPGAPTVILDSRSGEAVQYELDPRAARVLSVIDNQIHLARLARQLDDFSPAELEHCVAALRSRRLIFEEKENIIALVVDSLPPPPAEVSPERSLNPGLVSVREREHAF